MAHDDGNRRAKCGIKRDKAPQPGRYCGADDAYDPRSDQDPTESQAAKPGLARTQKARCVVREILLLTVRAGHVLLFPRTFTGKLGYRFWRVGPEGPW